jgi:hypothetical protein
MRRNAAYPVTCWIRSLREKGLDYDAVILEAHECRETLAEAERFFIAYFRSVGVSLLNVTDGGDGPRGYHHTEATRALLSAAHKGKPRPREVAEAIGRAHKGKVIPQEMRDRISNALRGRPLSPERRAKLAASGIGRRPTEETRAKLRAAAVRREATKRAARLAALIGPP